MYCSIWDGLYTVSIWECQDWCLAKFLRTSYFFETATLVTLALCPTVAHACQERRSCVAARTWAELGGCLGIPRNTQLFPQTIMYIWSMYICITYIRLYSLFSRLEISQIRSLEVPSPTNPLSVHVSIQSISRTFLYNRVLVPKNQNPVARMQIAACSRCLGWRGGTSRRKLAMH